MKPENRLGISLDSDGRLRVQNRGQYLSEPYIGQFSRLKDWLSVHGEGIALALSYDFIIFGEWCAAKHSLDYDALPDLFLVFDVYDRHQKHFMSVNRRNGMAKLAGLTPVPEVARGRFKFPHLKKIIDQQASQYRLGPMEGIIIRYDVGDWCEAKAKLVRADFVQSIEEHWSRKRLVWNRVHFV